MDFKLIEMFIYRISNYVKFQLFDFSCQKKAIYIYSFSVYRQISNIRCTLVGNKIVDHSDVFEALPVGAAPTASSLST